MADVILKVMVLLGFKDSETKEQRNPGDVLDMTPDRYAQAVASLARWPGKFLEVVEAAGEGAQEPVQKPPAEPVEAPAAELAADTQEPPEPKGRAKKKE